MSKWDRVDLSALTKKCCITLVQRRVQLAAGGELLVCPGCGQKLEYRDNRWRRMQDQFRADGVSLEQWPDFKAE